MKNYQEQRNIHEKNPSCLASFDGGSVLSILCQYHPPSLATLLCCTAESDMFSPPLTQMVSDTSPAIHATECWLVLKFFFFFLSLILFSVYVIQEKITTIITTISG